MLKNNEILETISMIKEQNLDVRTITLGLSLMDCACEDVKVLSEKIYDKITKTAENLVKTGEDIEKRFGIPIINKRISVTPVSIVAASCNCNSYLDIAKAMDKAAKEVGVDFIGGQGPGESITEAYAMEKYLVENGVPKDKIVLENKATSTYENLNYSKKIIENLSGKPIKDLDILVVTTDFHAMRCNLFIKSSFLQIFYGLI